MEDINKKDREKKEELYYVYMASKSLFMEAEEELAAVSHEIRAFFDTADFICINVRKQMAESLKRISTRKLKRYGRNIGTSKREYLICRMTSR